MDFLAECIEILDDIASVPPEGNLLVEEHGPNCGDRHGPEQSASPSNRCGDNSLARLVMHRVDARTNYHSFTGNVDAVTGQMLRGKLLHRITGEVYEGPFASDGQRHGRGATCHFVNGMTFAGSYECDKPKSGTWTGPGFTYTGPVIAVAEGGGASDGDDDDEKFQNDKIGPRDERMDDSRTTATGIIGHVQPSLPGNVRFHGSGVFARADGLVYRGEFVRGLAHGVGKEILPGRRGTFVGEYCRGLRHGIGTLMEDETESEDELEFDVGGDNGGGSDGPDFAAGERLIETSRRPALASPTTDDNPDYLPTLGVPLLRQTAGENGLLSEETPLPNSQREKRQSRRRRRTRKRYASGVWCAGQFEIVDSRGTVRCDGGGKRSSAEAAEKGEGGRLTRTTWDLLPEKWLGM